MYILGKVKTSTGCIGTENSIDIYWHVLEGSIANKNIVLYMQFDQFLWNYIVIILNVLRPQAGVIITV